MVPPENLPKERIIGRYALFGEIASGGMATVHFGRMLGAVGFSRTVAIKCLHSQFAKDTDFVSMFLDEARLAARINHPNVVQTVDVVSLEGELFIVMEYIRGEALSRLTRTARRNGELIPPRVVATIISGLLHGLHAAHEACDEHGQPLGIVHRDVSPQNVMVGTDGVSRVLDFGVAKAAGRLSSTRDGQLKGKFAYMAPEQVRGGEVDRRVDIYAAAVVLWEALTGRRMIDGESEAVVLSKVLDGQRTKPSELNPNLPKSIDVVVMRGLEMDPARRYATAREMAIALERAIGLASQREVGEWVERAAADALAARAIRIKEIESRSSVSAPLASTVSEIVATAKAAEHASDAPTQFYAGTGASGVSRVSQLPEPTSQASSSSQGAYLAPSTQGSYISAPISTGAPIGTGTAVTTIVSETPRSVNVALFVMAGATLLFAGVAAIALFILARDRQPAAAPAAPATVTVAATAVATASTPATAAAAAPPATASAVATASASATASAVPATVAATATVTAAGKAPSPGPARTATTAPTPTPTPKPAGDCDVPYTIDASGIKRPKPHCYLAHEPLTTVPEDRVDPWQAAASAVVAGPRGDLALARRDARRAEGRQEGVPGVLREVAGASPPGEPEGGQGAVRRVLAADVPEGAGDGLHEVAGGDAEFDADGGDRGPRHVGRRDDLGARVPGRQAARGAARRASDRGRSGDAHVPLRVRGQDDRGAGGDPGGGAEPEAHRVVRGADGAEAHRDGGADGPPHDAEVRPPGEHR